MRVVKRFWKENKTKQLQSRSSRIVVLFYTLGIFGLSP